MENFFFEEELKFIENDGVRDLTIEVLKNVNDQFYHAAASSTGKYHPEYALGEGGLYRHTKAAVKIANDLLNLKWYQNIFTPLERDRIIAALILHDTCKSGRDWDNKYTMHTHPLQAANLIQDISGTEDALEVARLVRAHMGQWCEPGRWNKSDDRTVLPVPEKDDEFFVHLCDYLASRKYLEVKGIEN